MNIPDGKRWLILAAHYDDEALFFGDLLIELADRHKDIMIAVLTGVEHCNPPKTPEQVEREPQRQRNRLDAFERVCDDLLAQQSHFHRRQILDVKNYDERISEFSGASFTFDHLIHRFAPDIVVTHAPDGDYREAKYAAGWEVARNQHRWASNLASIKFRRDKDAPRVMLLSPQGDIVVPHREDESGLTKRKLLEYYRSGCTQTPTWDAERIYPEIVAGPERYVLVGTGPRGKG